MIKIEIADQQTALRVGGEGIRRACQGILADAGYELGAISVAIVDDPTIHELNRRHLAHDYPTDVLSFSLEDDPPRIEGEVIVSADTALANAPQYGWPAEHELLLYVIHGVLHLVGYRDKADVDQREMRAAERHYLAGLGVNPPTQEAASS